MKVDNQTVQAIALPAVAGKLPNRWVIAAAGVAVQMMLGTVYAWSVFKTPIMNSHKNWREFDVGITFAMAIFILGFSAALGGKLVDKAGTRLVAAIAAVLFGGGTILAGLANQIGSLWLLWLGYGLIAGVGNGLGYVMPVAVLVRWFPDRKGFITGLAVMGFGLGAVAMTMIARALIDKYGDFAGVSYTFYIAGAIFLAGIMLAGRALVNPPAGHSPAQAQGKSPAKLQASVSADRARRMPQLYILWAILLLNVVAGIALLSNMSPLAKHNLGIAPTAAAAIVMMSSFFNGFGRLFWGTLSEKLGRRNVFLLLFVTQIPLFILLPHVTSYWTFAAIACYIMLCYGGGFGTMPSFTADTFGPKNIGAIYGMVLFAWGVAGGVGPSLMEWIKKATDSFDIALYVAAGLLTLGLLVTMLYRKPKIEE